MLGEVGMIVVIPAQWTELLAVLNFLPWLNWNIPNVARTKGDGACTGREVGSTALAVLTTSALRNAVATFKSDLEGGPCTNYRPIG